jgi:hypothetical protein
MERRYDLFQVLPDGTLVWRETLAGHAAAVARLQRVAVLESCEFRLLYLPDKTVIATMNTQKKETSPPKNAGGPSP